MHADVHLQLHRLHATELHREATATATTTAATRGTHAPAPALRVQIGWKLVEFGLRLATNRPAADHFTTAA
ncbi:hypothetical protein ACFQ6B_14970 [Streptomyces wedmorensis]|uniref:Uncharacterized protein n=1 Tax=Streptomyces wedmorensis TaxID=43759 RepID=A0ABW6IV82_STRWE